MKRQWKILLCLLMVLATLSACSGPQEQQKVFAEVTQVLGPTVSSTATTPPSNPAEPGGVSVFAQNPSDLIGGGDGFTGADALGEEDYLDDGVYGGDDEYTNDYGYADVYSTPYPYAGSTPIPLDPVDMPSPTPRAAVVFQYDLYTIASLGLSFNGPSGWIPDESVSEMFTLTEPESQMKDSQLGVIKIYASPVNSNYTESNLKSEITQRLKDIGSTNFDVWSPTMTASRFLMGSKGIYANYSGTLANGVKVGGRIHTTCIDKVLYTIEIMFPLGYKEDYLNVFSEMRTSIKRQ